MKKLQDIDKYIRNCLKSEPSITNSNIGTSKADSIYSAFNPRLSIKSNNNEIFSEKKMKNFTFVFPNRSKFFENHQKFEKIKNFSFNFENSKKLNISFSQSEDNLVEIKHDDSNLKILRNLKKIILKIFKGEFEDFEIRRFEIKILFYILQKKFKIKFLPVSEENLENYDLSLLKKELEKFFYKIEEGKISKRNEEKNKFVYKLTMKGLKKKYYKNFGKKINCYDEKRFYEHYFGKLSKKKNLDILEFYDPLNQKKKKKMFE